VRRTATTTRRLRRPVSSGDGTGRRLPALPIELTEAQWTTWVIKVAKLYGWKVHHSRPAPRQSGGYSTPIQGDKGLPDLVLARDGDVIFAELKTNAGRLTRDQKEWLQHFGERGHVWRPRDRDAVVARLFRRWKSSVDTG
jgi:hypothetical protein